MGHYHHRHKCEITLSVISLKSIALLLLVAIEITECVRRPNIVIIMADDMGFSDVSMHGGEIPTPNIDAIGMNGVILNRFYTPIMCTPSRSSLLTGRYPIHTGMQHFVIDQDQPWGLGLHEKLMPEFFREAGYHTHLIGKWHLGFFQRAYTPNSRGFDSFFGYLGPYIDYWDHTFYKTDRNYSRGIDLRRDFDVAYDTNGTYATYMFTEEAKRIIQRHDGSEPMFLMFNHLAPHAGNEDKPMQAPQERIDRFSYIQNEQRRVMAAMISIMDDCVGELIGALETKGILNETIILFYSDNGAPTEGLHSNKGSNFPFRGQKNTPWEGAMRIPAAIWAPNIARNRVSEEWMHVSDVLPTLAAAADIPLGYFGDRMDGMNHWPSLNSAGPGPRNLTLHNIDEIFAYQVIVEDGWKLIRGTTLNGKFDGYLGNFIEPEARMNASYYYNLVNGSQVNQILGKYGVPLDAPSVDRLQKQATVICQSQIPEASPCTPLVSPCLFDLKVDPCENNNLALLYPERVGDLTDKLSFYAQNAEVPRNKPADPTADPRFYNNTWTYWWDERFESGITSNMILIVALVTVGVMAAILIVAGVLVMNARNSYEKP